MLLTRVELTRTATPPSRETAPPPARMQLFAALPSKVVSVARRLLRVRIPPPPERVLFAVFWTKELAVTVRLPAFQIPPPPVRSGAVVLSARLPVKEQLVRSSTTGNPQARHRRQIGCRRRYSG